MKVALIHEWLDSYAGSERGSIQYEAWPEAADFPGDARAGETYAAAAQARNLRATYNIPSNQRLPWYIQPAADWVGEELKVLRLLLVADRVETVAERPAGLLGACPSPLGTLFLPLEGVIDPAAERTRLDGEIKKTEAEIKKVQAKPASETFVQNAPAEIVAEHRQRQIDWETRLATLRDAQANLA